VEAVNWIAGSAPAGRIEAQVRIRYRHEGAAAAVEARPDGSVAVRFHEPVRALAPGQAAVFYDGERVLGGGWIAGPDA
jgi:tRNA-specific 2-thiouridylase